MNTTIDSMGTHYLALRRVVLFGPLIGAAAGARPLWQLCAGAPAFDGDNVDKVDAPPTALDQAHPLRVLAAGEPQAPQDGFPAWQRPELVALHLIVGSDNAQYAEFNDPDNDTLAFGWAPGPGHIATSNRGTLLRSITEEGDADVPEARFLQVVGQPVPSGKVRWPAQTPAKILVPPMRLVSGRVALDAKLQTHGSAAMDWLVRLGVVRTGAWSRIWLVPDGIEFDADLPFPGHGKLLRGRVLLHYDGAGYRLTLLQADQPEAWQDAWQAITPAPGQAGLPGLAFSVRRSGALPGFSWKLADDPRHATVAKAIYLSAADFRLALTGKTSTGGNDGVAVLALPELEVAAGRDTASVIYSFNVAPGTKPQVTLTQVSTPEAFTLESAQGQPLRFGIDTHRLASELRGAYGLPTPPAVPLARAAGVPYGAAFARPLLSAFIPLTEGWLQFPVPNLGPLDTASDLAIAAAPVSTTPRNVLSGFCRFRSNGSHAVQSATHGSETPPKAAPWSITIEQASGVAVRIDAQAGNAQSGVTLTKADVSLYDPRISARGVLWMSADRPDALEALPRLGAGPGAFVDAQMETLRPDANGGAGGVTEADLLTVELTGFALTSKQDAVLQWKRMALFFNTAATRWSGELLKPAEARAALVAAGRCIAGEALFGAADEAAPGIAASLAQASASMRRAGLQLGALRYALAGARTDMSFLEGYQLFKDSARSAGKALEKAMSSGTRIEQELLPAGDATITMATLLQKAAPAATMPWPAVAWLRHPAVPLAAQMPMTRCAAGAVRPLESRDLLPFAVLRDPKDYRTARDTGALDLPLATLLPGAGPLLQLDLAGRRLQLAARWPAASEDDSVHALPQRGIALAAVGVAGVELRVAAAQPTVGKVPVYEGAVRYDLPLLDEAFATASLPPPAGMTAEQEPPRPPATALDWPLLAQFWDEQERKLQNSRVADSYLCGFRPLDQPFSPKVANLVRGHSWTPSVFIDTSASAPGYGSLTIDGQHLSGNEALRGYGGTVAFDDGASVPVLGFSPATLPSADSRFELDNRGVGARPMEESGSELLTRAVTWPGAGQARLVTLAEPADVTFAGVQLTFWFKDVLFEGNEAQLPGGTDIDFGVLDDARKVLVHGLEWRLAAADRNIAQATFRLAHGALPCNGFWLQPLRLTGMTLAEGILASAVLECRLSLGPAGIAPAGAANLIVLTLTRDGNAGPTLALRAACAAAQFRFALSADVLLGATALPPRRVDIVVAQTGSGEFDPTGIAMSVDIAGVPLALGVPLIQPDGNTVTFTCQRQGNDESPTRSLLRATLARLVCGHTVGDRHLSDDAPLLTLELTIAVAVPSPGGVPRVPLLEWPLQSTTVTLLERPVAVRIPVFDEGDQVLALVTDSVNGADLHLSLALICRLSTQGAAAGTLWLDSGRLDGSIVADHKALASLFGPGIDLRGVRCEFSCEAPGDAQPWQGTAIVSGTLEATSAIGWPRLKASAATVPLPGQDRTGRVDIMLDDGEREGASKHTVTWRLAGHRLPLGLACAIAAPASGVCWTVPALARHDLARGASRRVWNSVEALAIGRPRAIVPEPAEAGADGTTFSARYRNNRPGTAAAGNTPGMRWPGLGDIGTVLQGALGAALRNWYWGDGGKHGDALMIAGGFLGVLRYRRGEPGRLLRLPVLAGLADSLAQTGFGGKPITLHWADGPAARAVALTRPTSPSPADSSHDALCAALLAGSLPLRAPQEGEHLGQVAMALLVEQGFYLQDGAAAQDTPFFLASAVAVDRLLREDDNLTALDTLALYAGTVERNRNGTSTVLPLAAALTLKDGMGAQDSDARAAGPAQLTVLGDKLGSHAWNGDQAVAGGALLAPLVTARSTALDAHPRAWLVRRPRADGPTTYAAGTLSTLALDPVSVAELVSPSFASPALGLLAVPAPRPISRWLAAPAEGAAAAIRDDKASGLAGLGRTLQLPAQAGAAPASADTARADLVWLAQARYPVYLPLRTSGLAGPVPGWLQPAAPRQRLPVDTDVSRALTGASAAHAIPQGFLPGPVTHCAIGERAGIMTLRRTNLLARLDAPALDDIGAYDATVERFGAPAQAGSAVNRALRTPRPGPLPPNCERPAPRDAWGRDAAALDRRIQASLARPRQAFEALAGSADIVQGRGGSIASGTERIALDAWAIALVASPASASTVSARWDGSITVVCRLEILLAQLPGNAVLDAPLHFLEEALLPPDAPASAGLKIGRQVIAMRWLEVRRADTAWLPASGRPEYLVAQIALVLDPRTSQARAPHAVLAAIGAALADGGTVPAVELQCIVTPRTPAALTIYTLALGKAQPLAAGAAGAAPALTGHKMTAPLTLRMPLYPILQERGALPLRPVSLLFNDPAYNRDLAGPPAAHARRIAATGAREDRGAVLFELAADRASASLRGTVTFMVDLRYERRLDDIAQECAEEEGATPAVLPGGDLATPAAGRETSAALALRIESRDGTSRPIGLDAGPISVVAGLVYELPLARLAESDGSPAALRAGDMLVLEASLVTSVGGIKAWLLPLTDLGIPVSLQPGSDGTRTVRIMLTEENVVEPPPALYAALLRTPDGRLELALHAQSPLPARVALVDTARCFRAGMMRRHADFIWPLLRPAAKDEEKGKEKAKEKEPSLYVIKCDRNGQGYWPDDAGEFIVPIIAGKEASAPVDQTS